MRVCLNVHERLGPGKRGLREVGIAHSARAREAPGFRKVVLASGGSCRR
jgi:hypothetical protein